MPRPEKRVAQSAQCPSCFTLNLVDGTSAKKRQDGNVTCVLCGTRYKLHLDNSQAAA